MILQTTVASVCIMTLSAEVASILQVGFKGLDSQEKESYSCVSRIQVGYVMKFATSEPLKLVGLDFLCHKFLKLPISMAAKMRV